jgi:2'-5' RNA ligase
MTRFPRSTSIWNEWLRRSSRSPCGCAAPARFARSLRWFSAIRTGPLKRDVRFYYHPHVTIAHHVDDAAMDRAFSELASYDCSFEVAGFGLYAHGDDLVWRAVRNFDFNKGVKSQPGVMA